ncbi:Double-stranded RNA-binding [Artemisia annua]|uniref:Double-stranded RNA-binding n=1 Tax=Artemisia annua TaxID=35608 RepID=A0A2U1QNV9_ARTAN|nr:Double-stranded RNA-binding [Artemisia annua]
METLVVHSQPQPLTGAGTKPHLYYKCLLTQYAQKLRKSPPVYQTRNEGLAHIPKYRSTVFFDGATYTSSNTFQHLKTAEMDVSRIAYFDVRQKSKTEAMNLIRENKMFCKSVMAEYADKINREKPKYTTTQLAGLIPVFRSTMLFNGVNYQGDGCKSKREAEQLVASAVILSYLDSESGNDMVEIINSKFRPLVELKKQPLIAAITPAIPVVTQPRVPEVSVQKVDSTAVSIATQAPIPKVSVEAITPTVPVVTQPHVPEVPIQEVSTAVLVAAQTPIPKVSVEGISPTVPVETQGGIPKVSIQEVPTAVAVATQSSVLEDAVKGITPAVHVVTQPHIPKVSIHEASPAVTVVPQIQTPIPEVSVEAITPAIPVVTQPPCLGLPVEPINPAVPVVTQPKIPKVEEDSEYPPVNQTLERKRSRRSRKKANKKMKLEAQMSGQPSS